MKAKKRPVLTGDAVKPDASGIRFLTADLPAQPVDEVRDIALRLYGISGDFRELPSERDQNFLIEVGNGDRFVFKIANVAETLAGIDFQIGALRHIAAVAPSLPVPAIVQSPQGNPAHEVSFSNGRSHVVYLLTYLDGTVLSKSPQIRTPVVHRRLGALLASLDKALRGYFHPAAYQEHP